MNNYTIYIHRNKLNGKVYVGQTCQNPEKRWNKGKGYETSPRFFNAIMKYGWDNFDHLIIFTDLTLEQANFYEQLLISQYNSTDEKFGYNIKEGGNNGKHSQETKDKIGKANHIALQGKTWSEEQKLLMSMLFSGKGNPFYGKHHSEETKKKISQSRAKYTGENHPFYGKHHNSNSLQKISDNRKSKGGKKVKCINTGEIFDTMMDAARWCGLSNSSSIGQVCNKTGQRKTAGKHPITQEKLMWEFIEDRKGI